MRPRGDSEELILQVGFPLFSRFTDLRELGASEIVSFDPAFMQAMDRPWRDIVFSQPKVVASGMTPPDNVPT